MSLLQMSFSGAVIIIAVILMRALLKNKLPKNTFLILWGIALIRLLLPYTIPSAFSIYSVIQQIDEVCTFERENTAPITMTTAQTEVTEDISQEAPRALLFSVWQEIWGIGFCVCVVYFLISYIRCCRNFAVSLPINDDFISEWLENHKGKRVLRIRQSDYITTPISYGILHPTILLPKSLDRQNTTTLKYILEHELIHIQRYDIVTKRLMILALCIHWFNPFVWIMYGLFNRDLEIACDDLCVRRLGIDKKADYAHALIALEETKSGFTPYYNAFSKNAIEERIIAIMKVKKFSITAIICSAMLAAGIGVIFATSASGRMSEAAYVVEDQPIAAISKEENYQDLLEEYAKFGITERNGILYYQEEMVRYFLDGYEHDYGGGEASIISRYSNYNENGTVDVHTVRHDVQNADGSITLFGEIADIVPYSKEEFEARDVNSLSDQRTEATAEETESISGESIEDRLKKFEEYGITYQKINGSQGNIYFSGELVGTFIDAKPDGSIFMTQSVLDSDIIAHAIYDNEALIGVACLNEDLPNEEIGESILYDENAKIDNESPHIYTPKSE